MMFTFLDSFQDLFITWSQRSDGSMRGDRIDATQAREHFLSQYHVDAHSLVRAELVHGGIAQSVTEDSGGATIRSCDGLITKTHDLFLSITVADCLPLFLFDPVHRGVGLLHAGWRSLDADIISHAWNMMRTQWGTDAKELRIGIGPGIGRCHFEVQSDVWERFQKYPDALHDHVGKRYIDIKQVAKQQWRALGVSEEHIEIDPACTFCEQRKYFSYRRDHPQTLQAMIAVIGIRS